MIEIVHLKISMNPIILKRPSIPLNINPISLNARIIGTLSDPGSLKVKAWRVVVYVC